MICCDCCTEFGLVSLEGWNRTFKEVYGLGETYLASLLTLRLPSTAIVQYANSLDPNETTSNSASHPDTSCLVIGQHFHQPSSHIEALWKLKQTRNLAEDNLFGGLRVKSLPAMKFCVYAQTFICFIFKTSKTCLMFGSCYLQFWCYKAIHFKLLDVKYYCFISKINIF